LTFEAYAKARHAMRAELMRHKKLRSVHVSNHLTLLFEDAQMVRYQIQEVLRIEKVFAEESIQVEGQPRVYAIADEDLDRENDEKTSVVHFVRFELSPEMKDALKGRAQMMIGCDHPNYPAHLEELPVETLAALVKVLS
jgi:hypothetical protein